NRKIAGAFPAISGVNRWAGARRNLATVLATTPVSGGGGSEPAPRGAALMPRGLSSVIDALVGGAPAAPQAAPAASAGSLPAVVAGRYGRGRTLAMAFPITAPAAEDFVQKWGPGDNRYYGKFCRNLVYWLTENSTIGRRRLVVSADKQFYRPGETITLRAATYDE